MMFPVNSARGLIFAMHLKKTLKKFVVEDDSVCVSVQDDSQSTENSSEGPVTAAYEEIKDTVNRWNLTQKQRLQLTHRFVQLGSPAENFSPENTWRLFWGT